MQSSADNYRGSLIEIMELLLLTCRPEWGYETGFHSKPYKINLTLMRWGGLGLCSYGTFNWCYGCKILVIRFTCPLFTGIFYSKIRFGCNYKFILKCSSSKGLMIFLTVLK
jgi:hypothetical protein